MNEGPSPSGDWSIAREILRYLEAHPEAKDTVEGIAQWWLRREASGYRLAEVEGAIALLLSRSFILETRRQGLPPFYQRNPEKREAIVEILKSP